MADVQLEHGYVAIANRLYEAVLQAEFRDAHLRIVLALIRVTYGWRQRSVQLPSEAQLARYARLEPHGGGFRLALRELAAAGVVHRYADGTIALQKDYTRWGMYSIAEARLEALFGERPEPGVLPESAPEQAQLMDDDEPARAHAAPTQAHAAPTWAQAGVVSAETAPLTAPERHRKTVTDKLIITARELACAANQGLAEHPDRPQPIPRIVPTNGPSHTAAVAISQAGVPLAFAKSQVYEIARTHNASRVIHSLGYFTDAVIQRWRQHEAEHDAIHAPRPAPVAFRRGEVSGSDPEVWKRAAEEVEAKDRARESARESARTPVRR